MFVKITVDTDMVGTQDISVYEVDDATTDNDLDELANELARENAEMYGVDDEEDSIFDDSPYDGYWERLDMSREEIESEYGEINRI